MKDFRLYADEGDGEFRLIAEVKDNYKRLWRYEEPLRVKRLKLVPESAYGAEKARVFSVILN